MISEMLGTDDALAFSCDTSCSLAGACARKISSNFVTLTLDSGCSHWLPYTREVETTGAAKGSRASAAAAAICTAPRANLGLPWNSSIICSRTEGSSLSAALMGVSPDSFVRRGKINVWESSYSPEESEAKGSAPSSMSKRAASTWPYCTACTACYSAKRVRYVETEDLVKRRLSLPHSASVDVFTLLFARERAAVVRAAASAPHFCTAVRFYEDLQLWMLL